MWWPLYYRKAWDWTTMPAKRLRTLAMIYAIVELQNPLPVKQCCEKEIWITLLVEVRHFYKGKGFDQRLNIVWQGRGACTPIADTRKGQDSENLQKALVFQLILAVIVCSFSRFSSSPVTTGMKFDKGKSSFHWTSFVKDSRLSFKHSLSQMYFPVSNIHTQNIFNGFAM